MKNQKEIQDLSNNERTNSFILPSNKDLSFNNKENNKYSTKSNKKTRRQNNSLDYLTKKFAKYVYNSDSDKINLTKAINEIKIKKRRIYDITNVFEGKK
jgi:hypothetical protein